MRVLVLGAYGLIGTHVTRALVAAGHDVAGVGRETASAKRRMPGLRWHEVDIVNLKEPQQWRPLLRGAEAVVNCAGALQDGARDNVTALQSHAMRSLFEACLAENIRIVVQISAVGAGASAATPFLRTKAAADDFLASLALDWVILRPGLVLAPSAYGASALIRALAAFPLILPVSSGKQPVQTIHADDVAHAVCAVIEGAVPRRRTYDLVEADAHRLDDLLRAIRAWLGFPRAPLVRMPSWACLPLLKIGDGVRWLGWRSPICSTAYTVLERGIVGDPEAWRREAGCMPTTDLQQTLDRLPSTRQDRWFARAWLLTPILILSLSFIWIVTGAIALIGVDVATAVLARSGISQPAAKAIVIGGGLLDLVLGVALLIHRFWIRATQAMVVVTLIYLGGATVLTPHLWVNPLAPLVKAVAILMLALSLLAQSEER